MTHNSDCESSRNCEQISGCPAKTLTRASCDASRLADTLADEGGLDLGALADRAMGGISAAAGGTASQVELMAACLRAANNPAEGWGALLCRLAGVEPVAAGNISGQISFLLAKPPPAALCKRSCCSQAVSSQLRAIAR